MRRENIKKLYIIVITICISLVTIKKQTNNILIYTINNIVDDFIINEENKEENTIKDEKILKAEKFLNKIYQEKVEKIQFSAYANLNKNYAFIYFIDIPNINLIDAYISENNKTSRPGIIRDKINYVVIHDTGNTKQAADAAAHANYITSKKDSASWHYTVGEETIYQHIPDIEVAYHAGDGLRDIGTSWYSTTYKKQNNGGGNLRGIGIETCVNSGSDYLKTIHTTAKLSAYLLNKYNLTINELKTHYDFSGKNCPYLLINDNYLNLLKTWTSYYLEAFIIFNEINVEYISKTNTLDDNGYILNNNQNKINYQVKLEYQNQIYIYDYETSLK